MRKFLLLLALSICATTAHADWQINTGNGTYPTTSAAWDFAPTPQFQLQQVKTEQQSLPVQHLHLSLKSGKSGQVILLSAPNMQTKNGLSASQTAGDISVTQQLQPLAPQDNALLWKIEFANNGTQEQWIETGLTGNINSTAKLRFWDGYQSQDVTDQPIERSTPEMAFPATMIQDSTQKDALVIALHPDNDISWITTTLDPQSKTYFYGGRFAIPAKQKITLTYVLYTLQPHFGELDAIDGYYARFPASFIAVPNSDPRLTGFRGVNSSYVVRNVVAPNGAALDARTLDGLAKAYAGWEWGYNPYKFSGDWYGRPESWNLPLSQGDQASLETYEKNRSSFNLQDIEQFHRDRINLFQKADLLANNDMAFYILDFVQAELAQKNDWMKYTYGYYTADDSASGRIKHWVAPYDDTWHIFPWATPFGDSYKRDLPDVLNELDTSSFAIDVYADSSPYRGPTTEYIPGWSYDGKGDFISSGLAYKRLVEFIHTLHKGNSAASVVANLSPWEVDPALKIADRKKEIPNYSAIFAPDAYIVEGDVSEQIDYDQPGRLFPKRYLFGKKYISSVGGAYHDQIGERIPWQTMSPNQIRAAYAKYLKKRLMAYYQGGLLPNYDDARGIKLLMDAMPDLLEIESRGFTAAPASVGDKSLQRRRYGDGLGAAVVYSNPTSSNVNSQENLLNHYFCKEASSILLPFEEGGSSVHFAGNNTSASTTFSLDVPSMDNRIVLLPLSLQFTQPLSLKGTTSVQLAAHQQTYSAEIQLDQAAKAILQVQPPRDFVLESIQLNGRKIQTGADGSAALQLTGGTNQLKVFFASTRFLSPEENLDGFNWKQFQVVVTGGSNERRQAAAQYLADYAAYYQKFTPAIISNDTFDASAASTPTVVITTNADTRGVRLDVANPNVLFVNGRDDFDTQQLAWSLCRLLDRHSPLMPSATFTDPSTKAMLDRIGLMIDAQKSAVAKPITEKSLQAIPGEDAAPSGNGGDLSSLDFKEIPPLPRAGWIATASSSYVDPRSPIAPSKALDGTAGTRWTPGRGKAGDWFMVDMGKMQEFNDVRLESPYPYLYFPRHYKAELSDDGVTWRAAVTGEGAKNTDIFWPTLQTARYIRITLTQAQDVFWSIDEFFVYKRALPQAAAAAPALANLPHLDIPFLTGAVTLDGNLDEPVWQKAATIDTFSPLKDHPITQPTQVKIFHDVGNFYIGITCHEANMDKLWEPATQRDGAVWSGDDVEIYLAPGDHDGQLKFPYYQLLFSPSGVQTDLSLNAQGQGDITWNADWQVKTHKGADYWSGEVRIPFAALRGQDATIWRANIGRMETPNGDTSTWAPMQRVFAQPSLFGIWTIENK